MQAAPPAQNGSKKGRGCLIAIASVMGVIGLVVIVSAVVVGRYLSSDEGKGRLKALSDGTKIAQKGMKAPGAAELRALGCDQAMILPMHEFAPVLADLDAGDVSTTIADDLVVTCVGKAFTAPPTCDEVASAYVRAVGGAAQSGFMVTVSRPGAGKPECQDTYDERGALIGGLFAPTRRR